MCECVENMDIRGRCEPRCPTKNTIKEWKACPYKLEACETLIENSVDLKKNIDLMVNNYEKTAEYKNGYKYLKDYLRLTKKEMNDLLVRYKPNRAVEYYGLDNLKMLTAIHSKTKEKEEEKEEEEKEEGEEYEDDMDINVIFGDYDIAVVSPYEESDVLERREFIMVRNNIKIVVGNDIKGDEYEVWTATNTTASGWSYYGSDCLYYYHSNDDNEFLIMDEKPDEKLNKIMEKRGEEIVWMDERDILEYFENNW